MFKYQKIQIPMKSQSCYGSFSYHQYTRNMYTDSIFISSQCLCWQNPILTSGQQISNSKTFSWTFSGTEKWIFHRKWQCCMQYSHEMNDAFHFMLNFWSSATPSIKVWLRCAFFSLQICMMTAFIYAIAMHVATFYHANQRDASN